MSGDPPSSDELASHVQQQLHLSDASTQPVPSLPLDESKNPSDDFSDSDDEKYPSSPTHVNPSPSNPTSSAQSGDVPADDDDEDEEEDEEALSDVETNVDLGFVSSPPHPLTLTRPYFPSKVGGRPAWLNPLHLPSPSELTCPACGDVFSFLMQIYAPLRDHPHLFHRTLFLFLCTRQSCLARHSEAEQTVVCYRSQLGRVNPFYSDSPAPKLGRAEGAVEEAVDPPHEGIHLCCVCGIKASAVCNACKGLWYCGRRCQKADWKLGHRGECTGSGSTTTASTVSTPPSPSKPSSSSTQRLRDRTLSLLPSYELTIEAEYIPSRTSDPHTHESALLSSYQSQSPSDDDEDDEGLSSLGHLHQHDRAFAHFRRRIAHNPEQVMRHERGGEELWVGTGGGEEVRVDVEVVGGRGCSSVRCCLSCCIIWRGRRRE